VLLWCLPTQRVMVGKLNIGPPHVDDPTSFHQCLMVSTQTFALIISAIIETLIKFPPLIMPWNMIPKNIQHVIIWGQGPWKSSPVKKSWVWTQKNVFIWFQDIHDTWANWISHACATMLDWHICHQNFRSYKSCFNNISMVWT